MPGQASPATESERLRLWQRVEQSLLEIRRVAETFDGSQGERLLRNADKALASLLVDSYTGEQLDVMDDGLLTGRAEQSTAAQGPMTVTDGGACLPCTSMSGGCDDANANEPPYMINRTEI